MEGSVRTDQGHWLEALKHYEAVGGAIVCEDRNDSGGFSNRL